MNRSIRSRVEEFCARFGLRVPLLLAPMAGACPPSLSIAVAGAGGISSCGALLLEPGAIGAVAVEMRAGWAIVARLWRETEALLSG